VLLLLFGRAVIACERYLYQTSARAPNRFTVRNHSRS